MHFDDDIFISYAHIDNETALEGQEGWVSRFHRALEVRVAQLLGKKPKIWRDPKLQGNDLFEKTLLDRLPRVRLLVSVLTPRYVQSEWCTRELREFSLAANRGGGVRVGDKARVFKILKTPIPPNRHPPEVQPLLGYEFFELDPETGRARELDQMFGPEAQQAFWARLDDLAHDIADLLERLETGKPLASATTVTPDAKGMVYLASSSNDLRDERDALKRDLQGHGYDVLPDQSLPLVAAELEAAVRRALASCRLSIHLFGRNYGIVPEGGRESTVVMEHEMAIERAAAGRFARLIWIPPGLQEIEDRQQAVLAELRRDPRMQDGADLLETPLEDLKTVIHQQLEPPKKLTQERKEQTPRAMVVQTELTHVYLICDQRDQDAVLEVEGFLFDQGFEVRMPVFEGDEAEVREDHEDNLRTCDAVLVYYGAANELWLRRKLRELQKCAAFGRTKPMLARAILVAPPATAQKARLRTREALLLHQSETAFNGESLQPLIADLRSKQSPAERSG